MTEAGVFCLRAEDAVRDLVEVCSPCEESLRTFGAPCMRGAKTLGSRVLYAPDFAVIATFDVWTDDWEEAGPDRLPPSHATPKTVE